MDKKLQKLISEYAIKLALDAIVSQFGVKADFAQEKLAEHFSFSKRKVVDIYYNTDISSIIDETQTVTDAA